MFRPYRPGVNRGAFPGAALRFAPGRHIAGFQPWDSHLNAPPFGDWAAASSHIGRTPDFQPRCVDTHHINLLFITVGAPAQPMLPILPILPKKVVFFAKMLSNSIK
jgi:hypothetical protein